jgi:hypothetical protein
VKHLLTRIALSRLGRNLLFSLGYRIRFCYTQKHRGEDSSIDDTIKHMAIAMCFGSVPKNVSLPNASDDVRRKIQRKVTSDCKRDLQRLLDLTKDERPLLLSIDKPNANIDPVRLIPTLRKAWKIRREGRKYYLYFKNLHTKRLELNADTLLKVVSVLTPLLVLGGIVKQLLLGYFFGFNVDDVFSISDYLSSSLSTVVFALLPIAFFLLVGGFAELADSGIDPVSQSIHAKRSRRDIKFLAAFFGILLVYGIIVAPDMVRQIIPWIVLLALIVILPFFLQRFFKNSKYLYAVVVMVLMFFLFVYSATKSYVDKTKDKAVGDLYVVEFVDGAGLPEGLRYVTSCSRYTVFWDPKLGNVVLVRGELIRFIRTKNGPAIRIF